MKIKSYHQIDSYYAIGFLLLLISLAFFFFTLGGAEGELMVEMSPVLIGLLPILYSVVRWLDRDNLNLVQRYRYRSIQLNLLLVAAFALNRSLPVFQTLVDWYAISFFVMGTHILLIPFWGRLPRWLQVTQCFLNGVAIFIYLYTLLPTIRFYPAGILGLLAFGIGFLIFTPLLNLIFLLRFQQRSNRRGRAFKWASGLGFGICLIFVLVFCVRWKAAKQELETMALSSATTPAGIPLWLEMAGYCGPGTTKRNLLLSENLRRERNADLFLDLFAFDFGRNKLHNPLAEIAIALFGPSRLPYELRAQLLDHFEKGGLSKEEQLWSANRLHTDLVETNVTLWPTCQMAFTEKTIVVGKGRSGSGPGSAGEAIYVFQLPEGAVVSSLSLWIDGKEEISRVASRQKAQQAYKTIVGVERRDPALVHWKEGNKVSVRIFPIPNAGSRKFKIGISSILRRHKGRLVYTDPEFEGPTTERALEKTDVHIEDQSAELEMPARFSSLSKSDYRYNGRFRSGWQIELDKASLSPCSYRFQDQSYYLDAYHPQLGNEPIERIYLNLHSGWTKAEAQQILEAAGQRPVYAVGENLIQLTTGNFDEKWRQLKQLRFNILPLAFIKNPAGSLIVYKPADSRISLEDLRDSEWYRSTRQLASQGGVKIFNIGQRIEPLVATLRELRTLRYESGEHSTLLQWLRADRFPVNLEDSSTVVLHEAGLALRRTSDLLPVTGTDHIVRLFQYNNIMRQGGPFLLDTLPDQSRLVEEARLAHIVTPYSSMVVLESEADYKSFDISTTSGSLGNAATNNAGAAPEPAEWALLLVAVLTIGVLWKRKRNTQQAA